MKLSDHSWIDSVIWDDWFLSWKSKMLHFVVCSVVVTLTTSFSPHGCCSSPLLSSQQGPDGLPMPGCWQKVRRVCNWVLRHSSVSQLQMHRGNKITYRSPFFSSDYYYWDIIIYNVFQLLKVQEMCRNASNLNAVPSSLDSFYWIYL